MSSSPDDPRAAPGEPKEASDKPKNAKEDPHENWEEDVLRKGELPGQNIRLKKAGDLKERRQELCENVQNPRA